MKTDLNQIAESSDRAIFSQDADSINLNVEIIERELLKKHSNSYECYSRYILSNLYASLSILSHERSGDWASEAYPKHLVQEINNLRKAQTLITPDVISLAPQIQTNLANALSRQGRSIESLTNWEINFSNIDDSPFVSSISKAKELLWLRGWISDPSHKHIYLYETYSLLKELKKNINNTDHCGVLNSLNQDPQLTEIISKGPSIFRKSYKWQHTSHQEKYNKDEMDYRRWCLDNRLFLNPLNDISNSHIADQDILQMSDYSTPIDEGPYLSAAFSSIKREFCFSRFLAYEGLHETHPSYEHRGLFLTNTLDGVQYSGSIEKLKSSFRICFSILDSITCLLNFYFKCESKNYKFSPIWFKENLAWANENPFINALYWLSCDLVDHSKLTSDLERWKAPNPYASEIRKIRNSIEHGWLRVSENHDHPWMPRGDFAHLITPRNFETHLKTILSLVRGAIMYSKMAISYNEFYKKRGESLEAHMTVPVVEDDYITYR